MAKISIIMPLYNSGKYLEECLNSVYRQTFIDYELICINDASKDSTLKILHDFQKKDSRIRIYSNEERERLFPEIKECVWLMENILRF